eukprot:8170904-Alexandrium_andersonii.AAC.1
MSCCAPTSTRARRTFPDQQSAQDNILRRGSRHGFGVLIPRARNKSTQTRVPQRRGRSFTLGGT